MEEEYLMDFDIDGGEPFLSEYNNSMHLSNEENHMIMGVQRTEQPVHILNNENNELPLYESHGEEAQEQSLITALEAQQPLNVEETQQQSLYKLNDIDTEASIKTEVKRLIFTKISEEISSNVLDDMASETLQVISQLKSKTNQLENKIRGLEKDISTDKIRIEQSAESLRKTDEMIYILKENIAKIQSKYKDSRVNSLLEQSSQQYEKLKDLKKTYALKLAEQNKKNKTMEATVITSIANLKSELTRKEEASAFNKNKRFKVEKRLSPHRNEIEKQLSKKCLSEERIAAIINKKELLENKLVELKHMFHKFTVKKENQIEKLNEMNQKKIQLREELDEPRRDMDNMNCNLKTDEEEISQGLIYLQKLKDELNVIKDDGEEPFEKLQQTYNEATCLLNEVQGNLANSTEIRNQLSTKIKTLNVQYVEKYGEKLPAINESLKRQTIMHDVKTELLKKQIEYEAQQRIFEALQIQHKAIIALSNSLDNSTIQEHENIDREMTEIKFRMEYEKAEYNKSFSELKKKKEYLLVNSKFLKEKSANLDNELSEIEKRVKHFQEENTSTKMSTERKVLQLNENKNKLATPKNIQQEMPLKTGLLRTNKENITKKVQFNDILSFKSVTSSENSNLASPELGELETLLSQGWIQNVRESTYAESNLEQMEEEFQ